jgi:Kef-type K+ transport system membrane component KefB
VNFLVPIFFVTMGSRVNLLDFTRGDILVFALVLTLAAIIGKQVCGLGVLKKTRFRQRLKSIRVSGMRK